MDAPSASKRGAALALAGVLVLAAVLRGLWVAYATRTPSGVFDPAVYFAAGEQISRGLGYTTASGGGGGFRFLTLPPEPTAFFPPGWPYVLGGIFWIARHTPIPDDLPQVGTAFNAALGVASVWLVYAISRRLLGTTVALWAALIVALWPNLVFHTAILFSETLYTVLILGALLLVVRSPWPDGRIPRGALVGFGAVLGLAALTRPPGLILLLAVWVAAWTGGAGWRRGLAQAGIAALAAFVVILPWTIRNVVEMDSPVAISTNLGDNLCLGHNPDATGYFTPTGHCAGPRASSAQREEILRNRANIKEAFTFAIHNPIREVELVGLRARYLMVGDHDAVNGVEYYSGAPFLNRDLRPVMMRGSDVWYYAMLVLALVGLPALLRRRDPRLAMLALSALFLLLSSLEFIGDPRYHVPVMPLVAIAAALGLVGLIDRVRGSRTDGDVISPPLRRS